MVVFQVNIFINKKDKEIVYGSVDTKLNLLISANSLLWSPILFYIIKYILYIYYFLQQYLLKLIDLKKF